MSGSNASLTDDDGLRLTSAGGSCLCCCGVPLCGAGAACGASLLCGLPLDSAALVGLPMAAMRPTWPLVGMGCCGA